MSTNRPPSASGLGLGGREKTYFEQQREILLGDVAGSLDTVLQNMNILNRNLEQVIAVGHEFSSVEALWSRFEEVMAKEPELQSQSRSQGQAQGETGKGKDAGKEESVKQEEREGEESVQR